MTDKPRKSNPTFLATVQFVTEFLGEELDSRKHMRYMAEMKRFTNPKNENESPIPAEDVLGCLRAMKEGLFGFEGEIKSIWVITYGDPSYLEQYYAWKKDPPPFYDVPAIAQWERITGQSASHNVEFGAIMYVPSLP